MLRRDVLTGLAAASTTSLLLPGAATAATATPKAGFDVWYWMRWANGPTSFDGCGMQAMFVVYEGAMVTADQPDYAKLDTVAAQIRAAKPKLVTLDIESWNAVNKPDRDRLIKVITYLRARSPAGTKFAYYGILPKPLYWEYLAGSASLAQQQRRNQAMASLVPYVDWIMPMLHAFETSPTNWGNFAKIMIAEARKYGKPVMPWLWMQYHETSATNLRYRLVPDGLWRYQLETTYQLADSVCLWGTRAAPGSGAQRLAWDKNAKWWPATRNFLADKGYSANACRA